MCYVHVMAFCNLRYVRGVSCLVEVFIAITAILFRGENHEPSDQRYCSAI